jgi:adenylate kinase
MFMVLVGPPGSGKGTQCERLAEYFEVPHLSTGEMLRATRHQKTPLARRIVERIDRGELIEDEMMSKLLEERLGQPDCRTGCLLDGFPRTVVQVGLLDAILQRRGAIVSDVIALDVPRGELVRRLMTRAKTDGRPDDTPETIDHRMEVYEQQTAPLLDVYRSRGLLRPIPAEGPPADVFRRILDAILAKPRTGP